MTQSLTDEDFQTLSLQQLLDLREQLTRVLRARFGRRMALFFSDVVDSTEYVGKHGDVAGRALLKRYRDLLGRAIESTGARLIDTAGDGAFCVSDCVAEAAQILIRLQLLLLEDNEAVSEPHRLGVRSSLHYGSVLAEGAFISGTAVNVAARMMGTAGAGEIRLSERAFGELPASMRQRCRRLEAAMLKGVAGPLEMFALDWRDTAVFPVAVEIVEEQRIDPLPCQSRVRIGRLETHEGQTANDLVVAHPDVSLSQRISRWHSELEMRPGGYLLRAVTPASTEVDGYALAEGEARPIRPGSTAVLGKVLTLNFLSAADTADHTLHTSADTR